MKHRLYQLWTVVLLLAPVVVRGQSSSEPPDLDSLAASIKKTADYIRVIGYGAGIAAVIYAGILYLAAFGNEEKPREAKRMITSVIVGLAFITLAKVIVRIILGEVATQNPLDGP